MRPVMRFHGGKFGSNGVLAQSIVSHLPAHDIYVEPFGGAASVLMLKPPARSEIYNDLWREVTNVFQVLRDPEKAQRLRQALELTPYSRLELKDACEPLPWDDPVEQARRTIVRAFMSYSPAGVDPTHHTGLRVSLRPDRSTAANDWSSYPEAIPAFTDRLKGVTIECLDALDLISKYDATQALFYVDPPYLAETRGTRHRRVYHHDFSTEAEHDRLADQLLASNAMVVLSGYDHPLYRERFNDWTVVRYRSTANARLVLTHISAGHRGRSRVPCRHGSRSSHHGGARGLGHGAPRTTGTGTPAQR
ncbi:DNA adenine methylase, partial [Halorhodospira halophila]|uniref:DNA adenine methylase n=1 Tax=Halorhodospira halophila TaxID=1053 RepID=UPI001912ABC9